MFEHLIKNLQKLEQEPHEFRSQLAPDEDGYLDRECPNESCLFQFKVLNEHWVGGDETIFYCPLCRCQAHKQSWYTQDQINEHTKRSIEFSKYLLNQAIHDGLKKSAQKYNNNSVFSIRIKPGKAPAEYISVPIEAKEVFQQKIECEICQTKFAVIGVAFFCPCCGHNSAKRTLNDSLSKVKAKINHAETIKRAISSSSEDDAVLVVKSLVESCLSDCVVAFQRFCEVVYKNHPAAKASIPFNCFQRLQDGSNHWKEILSEGYEDWLSPEQMQRLNIFFQRRHLLLHSEGIVDDKYIQKSGDSSYQNAQRIIVKPDDVLELLALIEILTNNIKAKL